MKFVVDVVPLVTNECVIFSYLHSATSTREWLKFVRHNGDKYYSVYA